MSSICSISAEVTTSVSSKPIDLATCLATRWLSPVMILKRHPDILQLLQCLLHARFGRIEEQQETGENHLVLVRRLVSAPVCAVSSFSATPSTR